MKQTNEEIERNITDKLQWQMAERDEVRIAKGIYEGKGIDAVYSLEDNGLLDGFYEYLEEKKIIELLKGINPAGVERVMVPSFQYVLLYLLKVVYGVETISSTPRLLFSNEGAMKLVGFNAHQIKEGVCKRGEYRRKKEKIGPICDDALAENIVKIPLEEIEKFFNGVIKILAKEMAFPKGIRVILDPTDIRTTRKWEGCGSVTRNKEVKEKGGKIKEIEITVFGWKLIAIFYGDVKIPLAAKLVKINEHGSKYTRELIEKAEKNLEGVSKIVEVVTDREQLDGEDLWWLEERGIRFIVPGKTNMDVVRDAREIAELEISKGSKNVKRRINVIYNDKTFAIYNDKTS